jgi:trigger factor
MANTTIERQENGTIKLTITLSKANIVKAQEEVIIELVKTADIAGFRKGKAPRKVVEEKLNADQVREETLKKLIPPAYMEAVEEHKLKPIMNPKLHVEKIEEGTDWVFHAFTCELPEINLGDYKKAVGKITAKSKIVVPGKEEESKK